MEKLMEISELIKLADIKEKQAFAFTSYYCDKMEIDQLQKAIDAYCENMAKSFVAKHKQTLENSNKLLQFKQHILSLGANMPHSGKRFYEALYKQLHQAEKSIEQ